MDTFHKDTLRVLTWHIHGNYLFYLTHANCIFYVPVACPAYSGYYGKTANFSWGKNVIEVPADEVKKLTLDCIIFQSNFSTKDPNRDYLSEQVSILSLFQLKHVPKIFIEHDPPRSHPTDTKHILYNAPLTIVHVTKFNQLMWNCGTTKTTVIEHGVPMSDTAYTGSMKKGVVVINGLFERGRRLGKDIFQRVCTEIPLDLIGKDSEKMGGLGEIKPKDLPGVLSMYRFFFYPARYTSMGLSLIEAMMIGMPIIGLSTTELPTVIRNGENGYIHTNLEFLIDKMKILLRDRIYAKKLGSSAKKTAQKRFNIFRFSSEWERLIMEVSKQKLSRQMKENNSNYLHL